MAAQNRILQSWIKVIGRILVLVALLAISQEAVRLYLTSLLKAQLQEPLPAGYKLDFQHTQLDWRQQSLQIRQLSLKSEAKSPAARNRMELMLPSIRLDLQSIYLSVKSRRLFIDNIQIESPRIKLEQTKGQTSNFTQSSLQALDSLSQYLSLLRIQKLRVNRAQLEHIQWQDSVAQSLQFKEINLLMSGFSIDSTLQRHSFLNADEVKLEILGQSLVLPQKDHQLDFDTLWLSTREKQIRFSGLSINPLTVDQPQGDQIRLQSPRFILEEVDFESAYLTQTLDIGRLRVQTPSVHFLQEKEPEATSKGLKPLKEALGQLSSRLQIDLIEIQGANIDLNLKESKVAEVRFDLDSILIKDFVADSSTTFSDIDHLPFQDVQLHLSNIRQYINPEIGQLLIQKAVLNSSEQRITVQGLQIGDPQLQEQALYQHIPFTRFDGIDIFDVLLRKKATVRQISCLNPVTRVQANKKVRQTSPDRNFYATLGDFFQDFFLDKITSQTLLVRQGQIYMADQLQVKSYTYRGRGIQLDQEADSWSRIVPSFELKARDYLFQPETGQQLKGDSLLINGQEAQLYGLSFSQKDSTHHLQLLTSLIDVQGLIIDSLFAGNLYADSLQINDPHLQYQVQKSRQAGELSLPVHIPLAIINRGRLEYQTPQTDRLQIQRFDGVLSLQDSLLLKFSRFEKLTFSPDRGSHRIDIRKGRQLNEHFSFEFNDLRLTPLKGKTAQDSALHIPNLRVFNWDREAWQQDRILEFQKVIADRPRTTLHFPDTSLFRPGKGGDLPLQLDTLLLFNAQLGIETRNTQFSWRFPSITVALYDLQLPAKQSFSNSIGSMLLGVDQGLELNHSDFSLRTAPIFYNSELKSIQTDSLLYQSNKPDGLIRAKVSHIDLGGINPDQISQENNWELEGLAIDTADLHFQKGKPASSRSFFTERWPQIKIQELNLKHINAQLELDPSIRVEALSLSGRDVKLDANWQKGDLAQAWRSLSASVDKVSFSPDPKQHYQLTFGIDYQSEDRRLALLTPELSRNLSLSAFTRQLDYRTDYWQLQAEALVASDFHPTQLFRDSFHFPKISLHQLKAHDFNDETIPLKPAYKPMLPDQIKALSVPFLIDTLEMTGDITYSAIAPLTGDSSWISFNDIDGRVYHLSNIPRHFEQDMRLAATARLYDQAPLEVEMQFQLDRSPTRFELSGSLQDLDLQRLNPILRGQAALAVTRGESSKLLFNLAANDSVAVGELLFRYKKLRVQLLDKEDLSSRSSFLSFWTNRLIQSRNPNWLRRRKGIIFFRRDQQKAIAHYWAHSILSGVVSSIGVKNTRRRLRKADLDVSSFSYETLLKEQLKRPRGNDNQE
ncbi:MAG TPA: hypothetical protein VJ953_08300 [Saprospiraceae bacterium]|nr:hypothetical protein [Saprospiraceae bacterium]